MGYCLNPSIEELELVSRGLVTLQEYEKCYYYLKSHETLSLNHAATALRMVNCLVKLSKYEECLKLLQNLEPVIESKSLVLPVELKSIYFHYLGAVWLKLNNKQKALTFFSKGYACDEYNIECYSKVVDLEFELKLASKINKQLLNLKEQDYNLASGSHLHSTHFTPLEEISYESPLNRTKSDCQHSDKPINSITNKEYFNSNKDNSNSPYIKLKSIINTLKSDDKKSILDKDKKTNINANKDHKERESNSKSTYHYENKHFESNFSSINFINKKDDYNRQENCSFEALLNSNNKIRPELSVQQDTLRLYRNILELVKQRNYELLYYKLSQYFEESNLKKSKQLFFNLEIFSYYLQTMYNLKMNEELVKNINKYFRLGYIHPNIFSLYSNFLYRLNDVNLQYELVTLIKQISLYSETYFMSVSNYLSQLDKHAESIECIQTGLKYYGSLQLRENLGVEYMLHKEFDKAIATMEALLEVDLGNYRALLVLCECHTNRGEMSKAVEKLNILHYAFPQDPLVLLKLANLWVALNHYDRSKELLAKVHALLSGMDKALWHHPNFTKVNMFLCFKLQFKLENWPECVYWLDEIKRLFCPVKKSAIEYKRVNFYKALVEYKRGFEEEALKMLYLIENDDETLRKMINYSIDRIINKEEILDNKVF